jgi:hypothetical protein
MAAAAVALAGCGSVSMPSWLSLQSSTPQLQTVQFESDPPGAEVRTAQGQTCMTPCALALPPEAQPVSFSRNGFLPQTVQLAVGPAPDHSFFESPPPGLTPNPLMVVLQSAGPPPRRLPVKPLRPRRPAPRPAAAAGSKAAPPPAPASASPFPPPPPLPQH